MFEIIVSTKSFQFPNIQLIDSAGRVLPFKKKRCLDLGFAYGKTENKLILGETLAEDISFSINPFMILLKDFLRHPAFFCLRFVKTWKLQASNSETVSFPVDIQNHEDPSLRLWVSRQAVINGFLPRDLEVSSELSYLRAPYKFYLMVRTMIVPSTHQYELYDNNPYQIQKVPQSGLPTLENLTFENVRIIAGKIILQGNQIIPVSNYRQEKSIHAAGYLKNNSPESFRILKTIHRVSPATQHGLFVGSSTSWFHFMIECVPRLMTIPKNIRHGTPIILPKDTPKQIVSLCELLTKAPPILVGLMEDIQVERINIGRETGVADPLEFSFRKERIKEAIFEIRTSVAESPGRKNFSEKIYVQRPHGLFRPLQNERSIRKMLEKQGFETVRPEELNLEEVFNIFSNARLIIAESGAAITNVLFAKRGSRLIELYPGKGPMGFWPELGSISEVGVVKVLSVAAPIGLRGVARDGIYISKVKLNREIGRQQHILSHQTH
jgi:hypothetical protein